MAKVEIFGRVVSNKMTKSVIVAVERQVRDGLYGKQRRLTSRFMAHDEANSCNVGDQVQIIEHRPLSKRKRWKVQSTISQSVSV